MSFRDYDEYEMSQYAQPPEGFVPEEVQSTLDKAKDWLELVVHHIYETGNVDDLEYALEELCAHLDVELPHYLPKVVQRPGAMQILAQQLTQPLFKSKYDHI